MTDGIGQSPPGAPRPPIVVATVPGQSPRVILEGARMARAFDAPLVVVHVDTSRFVEGTDPDGWVGDPSSPAGAADLAAVSAVAATVLDGRDVTWSVRQLVGDPAIALKRFGDEVHARLFVVGTRRRGFGESVREFLTGSVAARLTHRQRRPVLVVPLGDPVADDDPAFPD